MPLPLLTPPPTRFLASLPICSNFVYLTRLIRQHFGRIRPKPYPFFCLSVLFFTLPPASAQLSGKYPFTGNYPVEFNFRGENFGPQNDNNYDLWDDFILPYAGAIRKYYHPDDMTQFAVNEGIYFEPFRSLSANFTASNPNHLMLWHFNHEVIPVVRQDGTTLNLDTSKWIDANGNNIAEPAEYPPPMTQRYFPGHFVYRDGTTLNQSITANSTSIKVGSTGGFSLNGTRFGPGDLKQQFPTHFLLVPVDSGGNKSWSLSEYACVANATNAIDPANKTIQIERGRLGSTPRAFTANSTWVLPLEMGAWGSQLALFLNYASLCPRDSNNMTAADHVIEEILSQVGPGKRLAHLDGIAFDVTWWIARQTQWDTNVDLIADGGYVNDQQSWLFGYHDFFSKLRQAVGPDFILTGDGNGGDAHRGVGLFNGWESEGVVIHNDAFRAISKTVNWSTYWANFNTLTPRLGYVTQKLENDNDFTGLTENQTAEKILRLRRWGSAFLNCQDIQTTNAAALPSVGGQNLYHQPEMINGSNRTFHGWLGPALGNGIRMEEREAPFRDLGNASTLSAFASGNVTTRNATWSVNATTAELILAGTLPGGKNLPVMQLNMTFANLPPGDITIRFDAIATDPPAGLPTGTRVPRQVIVNASGLPTYYENGLPVASREQTMYATCDFPTGATDYTPVSLYYRNPGNWTSSLVLNLQIEEQGAFRLKNLRVYSEPAAMAREFQNGVVLANPSLGNYTFNIKQLFPHVLAARRILVSDPQDLAIVPSYTASGGSRALNATYSANVTAFYNGAAIPDLSQVTVPPVDGLFLVVTDRLRTTAGNFTWTSASDQPWKNTAAWSNDAGLIDYPKNLDNITALTGAGNITLNGTCAVNDITKTNTATSNFIASGNSSLTIGGNLTNNASNSLIFNGGGKTLDLLVSNINGLANNAKFQFGNETNPIHNLTVTGNLTVKGLTTINAAGTVQLGAVTLNANPALLSLANTAASNINRTVTVSSLFAGTSGTPGALHRTVAAGGATSAATGNNITASLVVDYNGNSSFTCNAKLVDNAGNGTSTLNLVKQGNGTFILSNGDSGVSTYTGSTAVLGGVLQFANLQNGTVASHLGAAPSNATKLLLDGGTLRLIAGNATTAVPSATDRLFSLGTGNATLENASANASSTCSFTNPGPIAFAGSGPRTLTLGGSHSGNNSFAPALADGPGGATTLQKSGPGTWSLTGNLSLSGPVTVQSGTLLIQGNGSAATGPVTVQANATLGGNGSLGGNVTLLANATLSPGTSPGSLTARSVSMNNGSVLLWEISDWNGAPGSGHDSLSLTGNLTLDPGATLRVTGSNLANFDNSNKTFTVASVAGGISGNLSQITLDTSGFPVGNRTWSLAANGSNLTLVYGGNGTGGGGGNSTATFADWANFWGLGGSLSDNFDGDKFLDGEEYAFDLHPVEPSTENIPASQTSYDPVTGNLTLTLTFPAHSNKTDILYIVRRADTPSMTPAQDVGYFTAGNWTSINTAYLSNVTISGAGPDYEVAVTLQIPTASLPRQFVTVDVIANGTFDSRMVALQRTLATLPFDDNLLYKTVTTNNVTDHLVYIHFKPPVKKYAKTPLVLYTHGGGWGGGDRYIAILGNSVDAVRRLLDNGIAVASIEYRLTRTGISNATHCVIDCKDAARFFMANANKFGFDPARIAVWGGSAGGHLSLTTAIVPDAAFPSDFPAPTGSIDPVYTAVCSWFPATCFVHLDTLAGSNFAEPNRFVSFLGGPYENYPELVHLLSPAEFLAPDTLPTLLIHGDQDDVLPITTSLHMMDEADTAGAVNVELQVVQNADHGFGIAPGFTEIIPSLDQIQQMTADFLIQHLTAGLTPLP